MDRIDEWLRGVCVDVRLGPGTRKVATTLARHFRSGRNQISLGDLIEQTGLRNAMVGVQRLRRYGWLVSDRDVHHPLMSFSAKQASTAYGKRWRAS